MLAHEVNFDGLIGPTHNYAGLSFGNVASAAHQGQASSPKRAALQGLAKMKLAAELGGRQAVLPPQDRPDVALLRAVGFGGDEAAVIARAHRESPQLLAACYSASSMWAANAATVSPSADTADGRVHFTPANLISTLHRSLEPMATERALRLIFADERRFVVHAPLPATLAFSDEGAANHTRLCAAFGEPGVEVFTFGSDPFARAGPAPRRFPARQARPASEAVARRHGLSPARAVFVQQHPDAIDAGVFHNDVIAVGHQHVLLYHEMAFVDTPMAVEAIAAAFSACTCGEAALRPIAVTAEQAPLTDAVASYLFNSQLLTLPEGRMAMICPVECRERAAAARLLDELVAGDNPIAALHFVDLRQSMHNGGGPACLRLRVVLTDDEIAAVQPGVMWSPRLHQALLDWINRHYRDELTPADLADPRLIDESRAALDELTRILGLGSVYPFQQ